MSVSIALTKRLLAKRLRQIAKKYKIPITVLPVKRRRALTYTDNYLRIIKVELFLKVTFLDNPNYGVMVGVAEDGVPAIVYNPMKTPPHCASPFPIKWKRCRSFYSECHKGDWAVIALPFALMMQRVRSAVPLGRAEYSVKQQEGKIIIGYHLTDNISETLELTAAEGEVTVSPADWHNFYERFKSMALYSALL